MTVVQTSIPNKTTMTLNNNILYIKGKKGILRIDVDKKITLKNIKNSIYIISENNQILKTTHTKINNAIQHVNTGLIKTLSLNGLGYKAIKKNTLQLKVGTSHTKAFKIPHQTNIHTLKNKIIYTYGINKEEVSNTSSQIKSIKKPDPYKGKGILYSNEKLTLKKTKKK